MQGYQPLYNKYRPTNLDQVVGQSHIINTLKAILEGKHFFHAYLFCGSHGIGKTSVAKIFACQLNYRDDPKQAQKCIKGNAQNFDIHELDAASHSGVDNIRFLLQTASTLPFGGGGYKVIIIDEVHMLSRSAFNALLQVVEQPPKYLVFIFATTEPQKLPLTLLSRIQRHVFVKLNDEEILGHLKYVLKEEGVSYEEKAISLIAKRSNGSLRDSLTLLEQLISYSDGQKLSKDRASEILGFVTTSKIIKLLNMIATREAIKVGALLNDLTTSLPSFNALFNSLIFALRDVSFFKILGADGEFKSELLELDELEEIKISIEDASFLFNLLIEIRSKFANSDVAKELFELKIIDFINNPEQSRAKVANPGLEETNQDNLAVYDSLTQELNKVIERDSFNRLEATNQAPIQEKEATKSKLETFDSEVRLGLDAANFELVEKEEGNKNKLTSSAESNLATETPLVKMEEEIIGERKFVTNQELELVKKQRAKRRREELKALQEASLPLPRGDLGGSGDFKDLIRNGGETSALELRNVSFHGKDMVKDTLSRWESQSYEERVDEEELKINLYDHTNRPYQRALVSVDAEPDSPSQLTDAELLNLLLLSSIEDQQYQREYQERLSVIPPHLQRQNREYYLLISELYILRATRSFILVGSENQQSVKQLNKIHLKPTFLDFVRQIFGRRLYLFATTTPHFDTISQRLMELKRSNSLPKAKPLRSLGDD